MLVQIAHRGPDGEGVWSHQASERTRVVLGHRRLAIIDLSEGGRQPMEDQAGGLCIVYNGELYNYLEVRAELLKDGYGFASDSDTEVILAAYSRWGTQCLAKFNGMFAFALYDIAQGKIFCARDRLGEKPFLYHCGKESFSFASEYKALLTLEEVPLELDEMRLLEAAFRPSMGLDRKRETVFRGVQQLLPGEALELDVRTLQVQRWRYWDITQSSARHPASESQTFEEFRELLIDSVRIRMRSDVPLGSCLSGGLDSSAIVCIARQLLGETSEYQTFTGRFPGTSADEWTYAQQVVDRAHSTPHVTEPTVDRFLDELPHFIWGNELPVASSSQFAQWCVFRLAKEHGVTVLLDGQGADEILGGYEQYFTRYVESLEAVGDHERLAREVPAIRERYPLALPSRGRRRRDRLPFHVRHWISNSFQLGTSFLYGIEPGVAKQLSRAREQLSNGTGHALRAALSDDTSGGFLTTLLRYGDRNSMAHSREVRLPFCDHRIVEFAVGLPPHFLMGDVQTKRLLRESMRGILPEDIRTRWNKQGFRPPQDEWFRSERLLREAERVLFSPEFAQQDYWIHDWWRKALHRVRRGDVQLGWVLFQPLVIGWWREHFLEPIRKQRAQSKANS